MLTIMFVGRKSGCQVNFERIPIGKNGGSPQGRGGLHICFTYIYRERKLERKTKPDREREKETERQRERQRERGGYIYIYTEVERETERVRERKRERDIDGGREKEGDVGGEAVRKTNIVVTLGQNKL
jgi:hypothetical protein